MESKHSSALVSVILPTYAEEWSLLRSSICSILKQTYKKLELIVVVDDPANSNLNELGLLAQSDSRLKLIINSKNKGLARSLNIGIATAQGEYIARMDADDVSHSSRIEKQVKYLRENPHVGLCGSYVNRMDNNGKLVGQYLKPTSQLCLSRYSRYASPVMHPTWLFRRAIFDLVGGYQDFSPAQDYLFLVMAIKRNVNLGNIPEALLDYREGYSGLSNKNPARTVRVTNLIREFARSNENSIELKRLLVSDADGEANLNAVLRLRAHLLSKKGFFNKVLAILVSFRYALVLKDSFNLILARLIIYGESIKFK